MTVEDAIAKFGVDLLRRAVFEFRDFPDGPQKLSRAIGLFGPDAAEVIEALRDFEPFGPINAGPIYGLDQENPWR
jgi:hypothetical protein